MPADKDALRVGELRVARVGALEMAGLAVESANATTTIRASRITAREVELEAPSGSLALASATLSGLEARIAKAAAGGPAELLAFEAQEVRIEGATAAIERLPSGGAAARGPLVLEPLDDIDGWVRAFVTDALWFVDAQILVPLADGWIDFNRVDVDHIGPDSSIALSATGVHVDAPNGRRIDLLALDTRRFVTGRPEGMRDPRFGDRGGLKVRSLVEALVQAPPDQPVARVPDPKLQGAMARTRLTGDLRLGNGTLGDDRRQVVLTGREQDRNRLEIESPALRERVAVRIPRFAASAARYMSGDRTFTASSIDAGVEVQILGAGPAVQFRALQVTITEGTASGVKLTANSDRGD